MKKNILFIAAALFLFLGSQSTTAQTKMKKQEQSVSTEQIQDLAMKKTKQLVRPLGLNKMQQEKIYNLFFNIETKSSKLAVSDYAETKKKEFNAKMDSYILSALKEILEVEQYEKYLELVKQP